ncbi:hypothetical protein RIF29_20736 [Crotalaria pallida]|uniref:Uncharacterized protein n=1 Tax=Crotalaria pallida TaxID=3830 RepID=A0AAN9F1M7_CROPI
MVVWSYPPTPGQLAVTATVFLIGASLVGAGAYLSYANIAPQQARATARSEAIRKHLRKSVCRSRSYASMSLLKSVHRVVTCCLELFKLATRSRF